MLSSPKKELCGVAINKERFNELIDRLSDKDLELLFELMECLSQTSIKREISLDDEPATQDDLNVINKAHEAYLKGELISFKDIEMNYEISSRKSIRTLHRLL